MSRATQSVYTFAQGITKHDSTNIDTGICDAVYVGGAGVVALVLPDDSVENFTAVAGGIIPVKCKRVNSTNTTATLMVALYH